MPASIQLKAHPTALFPIVGINYIVDPVSDSSGFHMKIQVAPTEPGFLYGPFFYKQEAPTELNLR